MKKIVSILLALAMALVLLASCAPTTPADNVAQLEQELASANETITGLSGKLAIVQGIHNSLQTILDAPSTIPGTIVDDLGREVAIEEIPDKILSLAPSNTEILFALGLGDKVVGRTDFCNYPPEVATLPSVGAPFPGFNLELIIDLEPDIVFSIAGTIVDELENLGLEVVVLQPPDVAGILKDIALVGKVCDKEEKAAEIINEIKTAIATIANKSAMADEFPSVFYEVDGTDPTKPWTTGSGTFQDSLITLAGGRNIGASASGWYQMNAEAIIDADPEIIILEDAQWGMTPEAVTSRSGWGNITAVKEGKIYPISNADITCRQSPRIVDGLEEIAQIIHPELFSG